MSKSIAAAFAALVLSCASAAATPILSGAYTLTARDFCQQRLIADYNVSGMVDALNFSNGDVPSAQTLLTVKFTPSKSKAMFAGFLDEGTSLLLQATGSQNNNEGTLLNEQSQSGSASYSNTDTTVTINGRTFNAIYGQIDKNGVAHTMSYMGLYTNGDPPDTCSEQGEATRQ